MDLLFVSSEIAPYSAHGPAADAVAALPKALRGLDHRVTVVTPLYQAIDPTRRSLARRLSKVTVELGGRELACEIYDGRTAGGVELVFIGHEELIRPVDRLALPGEGDEETALRSALFCRAAVEVARTREPAPAVVHAHDWAGALFALHARAAGLTIPVVLTIHDPSEQGSFDRMYAGALGLTERDVTEIDRGGELNSLVGGAKAARRVTTTSSTWAEALTQSDTGYGLHDVLGSLEPPVLGIPNGVDASVWNPATDSNLRNRFDPMDLSGKAKDKADLQKHLELPARDDLPLLGMIATEGEAAGFDLFTKVAPQILRNDCQIVVVFVGDPEAPLRVVLEELSGRWPDRMQVRDDDGELSHVLAGGADLVLIPARREPTGFVHMWAHRYGAVPVAHATGGLADGVVDCDAHLSTGSGFLFTEPSPEELLAAVRRAFAAYEDRDAFETLRRRVMRIDHSWERAARLYERIYRDALD